MDILGMPCLGMQWEPCFSIRWQAKSLSSLPGPITFLSQSPRQEPPAVLFFASFPGDGVSPLLLPSGKSLAQVPSLLESFNLCYPTKAKASVAAWIQSSSIHDFRPLPSSYFCAVVFSWYVISLEGSGLWWWWLEGWAQLGKCWVVTTGLPGNSLRWDS